MVVDYGWADISFETPIPFYDIVTVLQNWLFLFKNGFEFIRFLVLLSRRAKGSREAEVIEYLAIQLDSRFCSRMSEARFACSDVKLGVMIFPSAYLIRTFFLLLL